MGEIFRVNESDVPWAEFEEAAKQITCPVEFVFQWEDAVAKREDGIAQGIFLADGGNLDRRGGGVVTRRPVVADSDEIRVSVFASHPYDDSQARQVDRKSLKAPNKKRMGTLTGS